MYNLWPALEPVSGATGDVRSVKAQAGYQIAGLAVGLGIAIIGGTLTGKELFF